MRAHLLAIVTSSLLLACAGAPKGPGAGAEGDACRGHGDCAPGLLCADDEQACALDECVTGDDCGPKEVGQVRCADVAGQSTVQTCAYDGYRCLEWAGEPCPDGSACADGEGGPACRAPDGKVVAPADVAVEPDPAGAAEDGA